MSQTRTTAPTGHLEVNESPITNLSKLGELARQAYEQKRTKDCLDLTRTILLIDPDNADAHWMRASIQSEMHRDLDNAREFLRQVQARENPEAQPQPSSVEIPKDIEPPTAEAIPSSPVSEDSTRTVSRRWLMIASLVGVLGLAVAGLPRLIPDLRPVQVSPPLLSAPNNSNQVVNANSNVAQPAPFESLGSTEAVPALEPPIPPTERPAALGPAARLGGKLLPDEPLVTVVGGTLAVSSPTSVDIFKDDAYLGSAPVSLELSPGTHTLEYRHGSLRKNVTHLIHSNETTRAMITFDVTIQINSKPWAEVYLDGLEKKPIGQTPLSGVPVPIGSVLIFENPQFQAKRYRVTGSERIQNVFP